MEQSVFGLEQWEQSYKAFYNLFLVKICILFAHTQFLFKIIVLLFFLFIQKFAIFGSRIRKLFWKEMWPNTQLTELNGTQILTN